MCNKSKLFLHIYIFFRTFAVEMRAMSNILYNTRCMGSKQLPSLSVFFSLSLSLSLETLGFLRLYVLYFRYFACAKWQDSSYRMEAEDA